VQACRLLAAIIAKALNILGKLADHKKGAIPANFARRVHDIGRKIVFVRSDWQAVVRIKQRRRVGPGGMRPRLSG
jgi:hypothetical protein